MLEGRPAQQEAAMMTPLPVDTSYLPVHLRDAYRTTWIEYGYFCRGCGALLGTAERPDFIGAPNRIGSGKHIRLAPHLQRKAGNRPYYAPGKMPSRADSRRHVEPEFQGSPIMAMILSRRGERAGATYVPEAACVVKCRCGVENGVQRP